jgi:leucyl/phenylalanyl-tRNA--protein transferase
MADESGEIGWYKPHRRAIIPVGRFGASTSLKKSARRFEYEFDRDFDAIVDECSNRDETWISPEIKSAYSLLFERGMAHCCGTYLGEKLVGGIYAAAFGAAMFGESMFHTETDAGKVALWRLIEQAKDCGYELFEVQFLTPHLESLGAVEIEDADYYPMLRRALAKTPKLLTS